LRSAVATASRQEPRSAGARAGDRHGFLVLAVLAGPLGVAALHAGRHFGLQLPVPAPAALTILTFLLLAPILEEIVFRGGLQEVLDRTALGKLAPVANVTVGNVVTSAAFAAAHLLTAPPWLAAAVFLPSLLLGRVKQLCSTLAPVVLLHAWYNGCYLYFASGWHPLD
jgi:membrane protease YdiL (CAAX protease family)